VLLIYGSQDPLVPQEDLQAIALAVEGVNAGRGEARAQLVTFAAGHGFLCEAREDFKPAEAQVAWNGIETFFAETLG
jgi:dienelactone hydrolase